MFPSSARWRPAAALLLLFATACSPKMSYQAMANQPRYEPYEPSSFFSNGMSAQPLVPGTVPRGSLEPGAQGGAAQATGGQSTGGETAGGQTNTSFTDTFPFPITAEAMARGQERFNIYCQPCHDAAGTGAGIVVRRGYSAPPSLHDERLRTAPAGYFYAVITNGLGAMPSYAEQIPPRDRWVIVAYIRALQLSQNATIQDVPEAEQGALLAEGQAP